MSKALVSPEMLRWARERVALSIDVLAQKLGTKPEKLTAWGEGGSQPTFRQAEKIAAVLHVPFGFLFLPEPPEEKLPIPDLRRHDDARSEELSAGN
ncbi:helix-turn-helix domain-containing protein (plasmid) [Skermanella rosea]|uniref:helix-turn-helix domain-containing protein n=1 Tax=Skermanella rosea TaxID=1817965 RepID=UPI0019322D40|nr:helix-turn-helix transcriptional regulator [Skermanella rosea]UEM07807.1 helix-turn-helix domain-containing protein [Skermanella rosea]